MLFYDNVKISRCLMYFEHYKSNKHTRNFNIKNLPRNFYICFECNTNLKEYIRVEKNPETIQPKQNSNKTNSTRF